MMASPQKYMLRVYVATYVAMKLTLVQRPKSVEELKKFKPRLDGEFTLQYEDPDFDAMLNVLMNIDELPEKGILKVVHSESDDSSLGSSDTELPTTCAFNPAPEALAQHFCGTCLFFGS